MEDFDCAEVGVLAGVEGDGVLWECGVLGCGEGYYAGGCEVGPKGVVLRIRTALVGGVRVGEAASKALGKVLEGC